MPKTSRAVQKMDIEAKDLPDPNKTRELIREEEDAVNSYETMAEATHDPKAKKVYTDIAREEKVHAGELRELLESQDSDADDADDEGEEEVEELMGKMVNREMTSEQAWADFKSGYKDFDNDYEGQKAVKKAISATETSLDAKLDVLTAQMREMSTDLDRLTDIVPQVLGEQNEDKAEDAEAEDAESMLGEDAGLEDFSGFGDEGYEEGDEGDENMADEEDASNQYYEDVYGDEEGEEDEEDEDVDTESDSDDDGDYESVDDLLNEDDSDEDETDEEESDEDETDEVMEKMVKAISKLNNDVKRQNTIIKMQERKIKSMQAKLDSQMGAIRKFKQSNSIPIRKSVGTVDKPSAGYSFAPNGIMKSGADHTLNKPVIGKSTPQEVFDYCYEQAGNRLY